VGKFTRKVENAARSSTLAIFANDDVSQWGKDDTVTLSVNIYESIDSFEVSALEHTDLCFIDTGVKYIISTTVKLSLCKNVYPSWNVCRINYTFQQDLPTAHHAQETVDLLKRDTRLHPAITVAFKIQILRTRLISS